MRAQASIDPKLISLLGRKLYSGHPSVIITRELLQNSVDACQRAGVTPDIHISIEVVENRLITIVCEDNGCGMSEEELVNDFLCLGGTNKRGTTATGGFGIAKAALMSGTYWSVETLGFVVDSEDVLNGAEIRSINTPRVGTKVTVKVEETTYSWVLQAAAEMIYMSDVSIHFTMIYGKVILVDDPQAGLMVEKVRMSSSDQWEAFGINKVTYPDASEVRDISGKVFVRLNGLVQFLWMNFQDDRVSNFLIDVYSNEPPDSKKYPMTISREGLTGDYLDQIRKWLDEFTGEGQATDDVIRRAVFPDNVQVLEGKILSGRKDYALKESGVSRDLEGPADYWLRRGRLSQRSMYEEIQHLIKEDSKSPIMKLVNYRPSQDSLERDTRVVTVWAFIMEMILQEEVKFGIGFIGDDDCTAMMEKTHDLTFFLINPEKLSIASTTKGTILNMWTSACHEAAHLGYQKHDSQFASLMSFILKNTSDDILDNIGMLEDAYEGKHDIRL